MEKYFKKSVLKLDGYISPPQKEYLAKLNQNENPFDVPGELKEMLCEDAKRLAWNRYPVNTSPELRRRLAEWHQVDESQILLGSGSNQIFQTLLSAVIEPGDKVIYCPPTFSLFDMYADLYGGDLIKVHHTPGANFPIENLLAAIDLHKPKIVLLCSPNNPTGYEMTLTDLERVCNATPGLVFWDEAYGEFSDQSAKKLLDKYRQLIISRTFSKAFSLAGLRFGYFLAHEDIITQLVKINIPYNVNLFTEMVAIRLLQNLAFMKKHVGYLKKERERLYNRMREIDGITVFPSAANFLLFKSTDDTNLFLELKKRGILVRDVSGYELLDGFQRVSIGSNEENNLFLEKLTDIFKD